jgi:hypothetical protein
MATTGFRGGATRFSLRTTQLLDSIIAYLESQGIGIRHQNLFSSRMPDKPDSLIAVYEYPGRGPEYYLGSPQPLVRRPRIQIQSRAKSYRAARQKAEDTYNALAKVAYKSFADRAYMVITPLNEPGLLTRDQSTRSILVFNCEVEFQPA